MSTFYEILGVEEDCTLREITKAYRERALESHPDRHPANMKQVKTELMAKLNEVYEILKDVEKREKYDRTLCERRAESSRARRPPHAPSSSSSRPRSPRFQSGHTHYPRSSSPPPPPRQRSSRPYSNSTRSERYDPGRGPRSPTTSTRSERHDTGRRPRSPTESNWSRSSAETSRRSNRRFIPCPSYECPPPKPDIRPPPFCPVHIWDDLDNGRNYLEELTTFMKDHIPEHPVVEDLVPAICSALEAALKVRGLVRHALQSLERHPLINSWFSDELDEFAYQSLRPIQKMFIEWKSFLDRTLDLDDWKSYVNPRLSFDEALEERYFAVRAAAQNLINMFRELIYIQNIEATLRYDQRVGAYQYAALKFHNAETERTAHKVV